MRITFITSSLEPGRDGVGDYTRRLAAECVRQGHASTLLSLNDPQVAAPSSGSQDSEGTAVEVWRLPSRLSWPDRLARASRCVDLFDPHWISLQFVPFGFHPRGFCLGLGGRLARINPQKRWHVMFHELWLGLEQGSPAKFRAWGVLQRLATKRLVRRLKPLVCHTQTNPYREALAREGIDAALLPLFSNIPRLDGDGWADLLEPELARATGQRAERNSFYLAGVFGAVHPEWNVEQAVAALLPMIRQSSKRLGLVFLGKNGLSPTALDNMKSRLRERAVIVQTGERSPSEISHILQTLDLGLATTPRQLVQKSSAVAAMLAHGVPVLVTRDDWHLAGTKSDLPKLAARLFTPKQIASLGALPAKPGEEPAEIRIESVAARMVTDLNACCLKERALPQTAPAYGH